MARAKGKHYVDNKKFLAAMIEWKETCEEAQKKNGDIPPVTNYIGECFLRLQHIFLIDQILLTIHIVMI